MNHLKRFVLLNLFICFSIFAQGGILYVKIPKENLRHTPGGPRIGELQSGTKVEVVERKPNWVKVQLTAWMYESSLTSDSTLVSGYTMRASHILVKTEQEAATVLKELKAGGNFGELAKKYSSDPSSAASGGDVGEFQRGDLLPEYESTVLKLKVGETSGVVKSALGFHIIKRTK